jgi:glycerol-3-phosphate dehydrogenase
MLAAMESTPKADFDLAVIGGGINGAGIARDAAGRGLRVLLVEQNDLASGTSSASTKLIHGGLRYLEHGAFKLVREALIEREVLLRMAPHIIRPMRFVLPTTPGLRSSFLLRFGLFIYDHLGGRKLLPATQTLDLTHHEVGVPLKRRFHSGYQYSDCWVDDARLVALNAVDAAERGAVIRTRTRCVRAERDEIWRLVLNARGHRELATARVLINAAGPWVGEVSETVIRKPGRSPLRLVKGSHIVVPKLFDHGCAYLFQNPDRRVVFAIPYQGDFTLIGTTDAEFKSDLASVAPSVEEIDYLCETASNYFRQPIGSSDVVWAYAGVRSLYDDGASKPEDITRDYHLTFENRPREAPLLTIYGGKITTYRRLAEAALAKLSDFFVTAPPWTAGAPLPGGNFPVDWAGALIARTRDTWPFLPEPLVERLVRAYGTRVDRVLGEAKSLADLGECFGADLTAAETRYLMTHEFAQEADDVLWRRSKLGLKFTAPQREALARYMAETLARKAAE